MKLAALYIAAGIKELTNTIVVSESNPEKAIEVQNKLNELSSEQVLSVIDYMLEDKNRELLDQATIKMFEAFREKNLIIEDKEVPISQYIDK